ncbi:hypothetical protein M0R45_014892 [Rubus argutus]|uniref:RING-type E3 ubiquitin transferase n=1 Tax=Rubus argutus TaxID=59490 RepID=A0AAW1XNW1_RUBAR
MSDYKKAFDTFQEGLKHDPTYKGLLGGVKSCLQKLHEGTSGDDSRKDKPAEGTILSQQEKGENKCNKAGVCRSPFYKVLQSMRVPRHEQQPIVAKIFEVVANSNNIDDGAYWGWYEGVKRESHAVGLDREELETYKPRPKPVSKSAIKELERVRLDRSCGICMEDFEDGFIATRFPCLHIFHGHCILSWLENHHNYCPMCRYPVPTS